MPTSRLIFPIFITIRFMHFSKAQTCFSVDYCTNLRWLVSLLSQHQRKIQVDYGLVYLYEISHSLQSLVGIILSLVIDYFLSCCN